MDLYGALAVSNHGPATLGCRDACRTIARIEGLFDGHLPSPAELLAAEPLRLHAAGLSWRKIDTLRDLAERLSDGRLDEDVLDTNLPDDDFISALTAISGIGPWTAQGVLLVALRREDVVLPGDLALLERPSAPLTNSTVSRTSRKFSGLLKSGSRIAAGDELPLRPSVFDGNKKEA